MTGGRDPIAFQLFKNTLFSIVDGMALTIYRTAYSGVLKDGMDYSTAFLTPMVGRSPRASRCPGISVRSPTP